MKTAYIPYCFLAILGAPPPWLPLPLHHLKSHREYLVSAQVVPCVSIFQKLSEDEDEMKVLRDSRPLME